MITDAPIEFTLSGISLDNVSKEDMTTVTNIGDGGASTVLFDADPENNGIDEIYGFTIGQGDSENDTIAFDGLDNSTLRGSGSDAERLDLDGNLGIDTGFVILTESLADLESGTFQSAALGLAGESDGDVIYFLASDGNDAKLAEITYTGSSATVAFMANFIGLGSLDAISQNTISDFNITGSDV